MWCSALSCITTSWHASWWWTPLPYCVTTHQWQKLWRLSSVHRPTGCPCSTAVATWRAISQESGCTTCTARWYMTLARTKEWEMRNEKWEMRNENVEWESRMRKSLYRNIDISIFISYSIIIIKIKRENMLIFLV